MKHLLLFLLSPFIVFSQTQIGSDINGEGANDNSGISVSLSADGSVVGIGASKNDGNGSNSGHVRIYQNLAGTWTQIGNDIDGEDIEDNFGYSVSISSDGSIVAVGAPYNNGNGIFSGHVRVFENNGGTWTQIGSDIDGEDIGDNFGYSVSISSDGSIVAVGAPYNDGSGTNSGHVRIFENIGGVWTQIGSDIDGELADDGLGYCVSLSSDGNMVAIGIPYKNGNGINFSGQVRVYKNINETWTQIGNNIDGEAIENFSGWSVSLSSDGNIVAIGAVENSGNGPISGHVRVYENIGGTWTQVGNDIDGEAEGDASGWSVSLSDDGTVLAVGAPQNDANANNSGHTRVYQNLRGEWIQIGTDIDGESLNNYSGNSVSLSSNGNVLAVGAIYSDSSSVDSGQVSVYDLRALLSIESFKKDYFLIYPNPAKNFIKIKLNQDITLEKVNIYNALGQFISTSNNLKINTSNFTGGVYFIEIESNKGKSAKKIVIE